MPRANFHRDYNVVFSVIHEKSHCSLYEVCRKQRMLGCEFWAREGLRTRRELSVLGNTVLTSERMGETRELRQQENGLATYITNG